MNDYEKRVFGPEKFDEQAAQIYEETAFYYYRHCDTCKIQRKPKASHCATCNNCVVGFDHHCTLLNNCIGRRNLRAFNSLLVSVWLYAFLLAVMGLLVILKKPLIDKIANDGG